MTTEKGYKPNVLVIGHELPLSFWGRAGYEVFIKNMIQCMRKIANLIVLITRSVSSYKNITNSSLLNARKVFGKFILVKSPSKNPSVSLLWAILSKLKHIHGIEYLYLVGTNIMPLLLIRKLYNIKVITHVTTLPFIRTFSLYKLSDILFVSSPVLFNYIISSNGALRNRLYRVPPPIDTQIYSPHSDMKNQRPYITILYLGALNHWKFPYVQLLKALKLLNKRYDIQFTIVAPPSKETLNKIFRIKALALKLGLTKQIQYHIKVCKVSEKVKYIRNSDIVLLPYTDEAKKYVIDPPLTLLEAMSCGKIVVTRPLLSIRYIIVDEYNGILIRKLSSEDIFNALDKAINNIDERDIKMRARETIIKNFSMDTISSRLETILLNYSGHCKVRA